MKFFPGRTLESLKGARNKNLKYKNILASIKEHKQSTRRQRFLPCTPSSITPRQTAPSRTPQSRRSLPPIPFDLDASTVTSTQSAASIEDHTQPTPKSTAVEQEDPFVTSLRASAKDTPLEQLTSDVIRDKSTSLDLVSTFIATIPSSQRKKKNLKGPLNVNKHRYKNKRKLRRYARFQHLFDFKKKRLAEMIINDTGEATIFPSEESIRATYQAIYKSENPDDNWPISSTKDSSNIYHPIKLDELNNTIKEMKDSAAGPDCLGLLDIRIVNRNTLLTIFNLQLYTNNQLPTLKTNSTILIPKKKEGLDDASNWRPITISSVTVRLLHKILAKRLLNSITLNVRQKAFIPVDGCAENMLLLDSLIRRHRKQHKRLSMIGIDLAKAFDTVSINSIIRALKRFNIDNNIIEYIINAYSDCITTINCGPSSIPGIKLIRGVKQGDPLSPLLFNIIINELLDELPEEIGVKMLNESINALAFADDLILLAESKVGMELLLKQTIDFFTKRGMKINVKKCFSLRTGMTIKNRAPITITTPSFFINNALIPAINYESTFKYLGINFNPCGKLKSNTTALQEIVNRLKLSPLKPQQKIHLLATYIIPKFNHQLVLGRITKGLLTSFDLMIRDFVKTTTQLPNDTPNAYLYSSIKDGGLGLPLLETSIPKSTLKCINKMTSSSNKIIVELLQTDELKVLKSQCLKILHKDSIENAIKTNYKKSQRNELINNIDGRPLEEASTHPAGQLWIRGTSKCVTGKRFNQLLKLRIGRLATLENCNRGRQVEKKCCHCNRVNESLNHILQNCHYTHFQRIRRHNSIVDFIKKKCVTNNYTVREEPIFDVDNKKTEA